MLHTFPFLIPDLGIALRVAYAVVFLELLAIAFIRYRFMGGRLANTIVQVIIGGAIVFAVGFWWDGSVRVDVAKDQSREGEVAMRVGFIGLGRMGSGMAANLVRAGHEVTVYNRSPAKAEALVALGAKAAASVVEACRGDAVMTMLANDEAVASVALGTGWHPRQPTGGRPACFLEHDQHRLVRAPLGGARQAGWASLASTRPHLGTFVAYGCGALLARRAAMTRPGGCGCSNPT
jgi:NAD binding domain of 6-phosphogluconate dehydrogenase